MNNCGWVRNGGKCILEQENKELKERINTYENPEDLTLMCMYCTEKVMDEIFKLKDRINKAIEYIEDKLKIYTKGLVGEHLGQEFLKNILELLKGDKE